MTGGVPFAQVLMVALILVPASLALSFVIYLCMSRRRENPKGTVYLGLAILIQLLSYTLSFGPMLLSQNMFSDLSMESMRWIMTLKQGIHGLLHAAMWILIGMAVFSRRADQYADLS